MSATALVVSALLIGAGSSGTYEVMLRTDFQSAGGWAAMVQLGALGVLVCLGGMLGLVVVCAVRDRRAPRGRVRSALRILLPGLALAPVLGMALMTAVSLAYGRWPL